jgi:hypothetical protein
MVSLVLSPSIYGGDHVIDDKSTHNCHAFMVNFYDGYMF